MLTIGLDQTVQLQQPGAQLKCSAATDITGSVVTSPSTKIFGLAEVSISRISSTATIRTTSTAVASARVGTNSNITYLAASANIDT